MECEDKVKKYIKTMYLYSILMNYVYKLYLEGSGGKIGARKERERHGKTQCMEKLQ